MRAQTLYYAFFLHLWKGNAVISFSKPKFLLHAFLFLSLLFDEVDIAAGHFCHCAVDLIFFLFSLFEAICGDAFPFCDQREGWVR